MRKVIAVFVAVVAVSGHTVHAHHSFAATYFEDREVTIEGTLAQFMFRNPH
jgi:hypothetical protein